MLALAPPAFNSWYFFYLQFDKLSDDVYDKIRLRILCCVSIFCHFHSRVRPILGDYRAGSIDSLGGIPQMWYAPFIRLAGFTLFN
jgi:hypothetical protein